MNLHRVQAQFAKHLAAAIRRPHLLFNLRNLGCLLFTIIIVLVLLSGSSTEDEGVNVSLAQKLRAGAVRLPGRVLADSGRRQKEIETLKTRVVELTDDKSRLQKEVLRLQAELSKRAEHDIEKEEKHMKVDDQPVTKEGAPPLPVAQPSGPSGVQSQASISSAGSDKERRDAVKKAFLHAWNGYVKYAWGHDELTPVSKGFNDPFGGLGATLVDSLDTMYLMGLTDEYKRAHEWVEANLFFNQTGDVSFFETTIRCLGGLLSMYDLTQDSLFLERAKDLGDHLMPAFNTPTGIPLATVHLAEGRASGPSWSGGISTMSEVATVQLEFSHLSFHTGDPKYAEKANAVIDILDKLNVPNGLYGKFIDPNSGRITDTFVTLGARGDSTYEYFLKMWLLTGRSSTQHRRMYDASMDGVTRLLVQTSSPSNLKYIAEMDGMANLNHKMDHLTCFVPGMLVIGAQGDTKDDHLQLAADLLNTCREFYRRQETGLSPELVKFTAGHDFSTDSWHNLLRPETVESLFVLYRYTHDPKYREWGWEIFQAFEKHSKTEAGYSGLRDVRVVGPAGVTQNMDDRMESFWMAETLKYLYLLFGPDEVVPLHEWVFNTEAHPLKIHPTIPPQNQTTQQQKQQQEQPQSQADQPTQSSSSQPPPVVRGRKVPMTVP
mmetsp:Transcript_18905/g.31011  ORF Transcript_18905/g.31011 Transcript_18905/m.31011 type:complete len:661 (-) Transcript_18905:94-2076(-)|eukprot:CAMPEP_0184662118 /NCGR_PEP_ID=MMETSP0308-20130426/41680_1 /TAXON_ID=38269 /ORGANISM="Gloeochaete witrockiana, Strain SAG 46.84" /LENGTH=660 /DNA_ID=CAMNT_0027103895 /DNA_START=166 /DNA_END=2148 /DNA_ORIENTATION=-